MDRILEPEIMDGEAEAAAYARADFSDSNQAYVADVMASFPDRLDNIVDLGCGPGDIAIRLGRDAQRARITGVDGSAAMLHIARAAVRSAGLESRVKLLQGRIPGVDLSSGSFDLVLSKDMLHHLPDPQVLWHEVRRLGRAGAAVCVVDLCRPESPAAAHEIVERVSGSEHPLLKTDFYNSLCAAFTAEEIRAQLAVAGLSLTVSQLTERHLRVKGRLPG
ncbi:MAG TPA: class I SAM-dependent methyltransferase [Steroidobacteraceae bacterium]|nr:class I SAM-dependent methyltransferase [Steroidobacteraceae bacterium]